MISFNCRDKFFNTGLVFSFIKFYKNKTLFLLVIIIFLITKNAFSQSNPIEKSGDIILIALPISALGTTLINKDYKGTWQFTKGFVVNKVMTYGLKTLINKPRPDFSNNNAFPSGHTSITFQSAAFIQQRYGWKYGFPAYAFAGFTAYSRINAKKHDVWDIFAGAIIGIGSSYLFTTEYQKKHMNLTFSSGDKNYSLGFKYKF